MKLRVGDKVKFLNEKGGGIVSRIVDPRMVHVTIEGGFEIPILASELIRIEEEAHFSSPKHMFREEFDVNLSPPQTTTLPEEPAGVFTLTNNRAKGVVDAGIYLAFVPQDQKWLITGPVDIYLVNHTSFDILYSLWLKKPSGRYTGLDYGSAGPESRVLIATESREDLSRWENSAVQILFHGDEAVSVPKPGHADVNIRRSRFVLETNYRDSSIMHEKSVLVSLVSPTETAVYKSGDSMQQAEEFVSSRGQVAEPVHIIEKHRTGPTEAVVDLHIHELAKDTANLESKDILRIQVAYFTDCLENAIALGLTKVIFIHGVGTGVLKTAMKEILKDYEFVEFRDASMKQFGYGAMEVIIRSR